MPPVVWWEIESPDPEAFQRFHAGLWGWEYERAFADTELGADYWIMRDGGKGIGGLQRSAAGTYPQAGTRLYLEVGNLEETLRQAGALGGTIERTRTALGGDNRWFALIRDPSGVSFGLWTEQGPGPAGQ